MATGKQTEIDHITLIFHFSICSSLEFPHVSKFAFAFHPVVTTRCALCPSQRKQGRFRYTTTSFPAKRTTAKIHTDDVLRYDPDLGSASDWLKRISFAAPPIRSTAQIWVVIRHQYGFSALVPRSSIRGGVARCGLFSQATCV